MMNPRRFSACTVLASFLVSPQAPSQKASHSSSPTSGKPARSAASSAALDKEASKYQELLQDPDVVGDPDIKKAIYGKWMAVTCQSKSLKVQAIVGAKNASLGKSVYNACLARLGAQESAALGATAPVSAPKNTSAPPAAAATIPPQPASPAPSTSFSDLDKVVAAIKGCKSIPSPAKSFTSSSWAKAAPTEPSPVPARWRQLNASGSGGEIYTKQTVWVGYINRLRYSASLGGTVTVIQPPAIPSPLSPAVAPNPQSTQQLATKTGQETSNVVIATAQPSPDEANFNTLGTCINSIQSEATRFQGKVAQEEITLNEIRGSITNRLNQLTPMVGSVAEAKAAGDLSIFGLDQIPSFPLDDVEKLRNLITDVASAYALTSEWAKSAGKSDEYTADKATATLAETELDRYLGSSAGMSANGNNATNANPTQGGDPGQTSDPSKSGNGAPTTNGSATPPCSSTAIPGASQEVADYEANRCYVTTWHEQFSTVHNANDAYFIVSYKPVCGGFFGQGTSTQMQLTIVDNLNPTPSASPTNLDKVVCEPALTISSGVGMSFIPDRTPAFVAGVEKDQSGKTVLDSNNNPVIVQTLGYSSASDIRPAYTLQVNTAVWSPKKVELHWTVGAMLTAATGGATTDIISGPAISFKKRAFFVSAVYDLGLRTAYQNGFNVGMPQGNLTSPPTQQSWKSGFAISFTFPFSTGTSSQTSSNSGAASIVTPNPAPSTNPPK